MSKNTNKSIVDVGFNILSHFSATASLTIGVASGIALQNTLPLPLVAVAGASVTALTAGLIQSFNSKGPSKTNITEGAIVFAAGSAAHALTSAFAFSQIQKNVELAAEIFFSPFILPVTATIGAKVASVAVNHQARKSGPK